MNIPMQLMEQDMKAMLFVIWDRFVFDEENKKVDLYGWIKREKDCYKDFVIMRYVNTTKNLWDTFYNTSSDKYSKLIGEILKSKGKHNVCKRVENNFKIKNMIILNK